MLASSHADLSRMMVQGRSFSGLERNCGFLNTLSSADSFGRFATISASAGIDFPDDGRALTVTDWDQDGDQDLWISARNAPRIRLLLNNNSSTNNFLALKLEGNGENTSKDAIGARVEVNLKKQSSKRLVKTLRAGEGFLSQNSKNLHFGLEKSNHIDSVKVSWPGGDSEIYSNISANKRFLLTQGEGRAVELTPRKQQVFDFEISRPLIPAASNQVRIPFLTRLAAPPLSVKNFTTAKISKLQAGTGGPVLLILWGSWCPTCNKDLAELTNRKEDLKNARLGVLALSVDDLGDDKGDIGLAMKKLSDLNFPFSAGLATTELIEELQQIHNSLIPLQYPLPIPVSFLIDGKGRLRAMYKGEIEIDTILTDAKLLEAGHPFSLSDASPFEGTTVNNKQVLRVKDENRALTLFSLGLSFADQKRPAEAAWYFNEVLRIRPSSPKTHYNLAVNLSKLNRDDEAIKHLKKALAINNISFLPHRLLGNIFLKKGDYFLAEKHFTKAVQLSKKSGNNAEIVGKLGMIQAQKGNLPEAEKLLQQAIAIDGSLINTHYNLATVYLLQNRLQEAEIIFLRILSQDPGYPDVLYNLGYIAESQGQFKRAINLYYGELRNTKTSPKAMMAIGRLLEKEGKVEQAKEYYAQAVSISPSFKPAANALSRLNKQKDQQKLP